MIRLLYFFLITLTTFSTGQSQTINYTSANGHAHNDYAVNVPFTQAYQLGFGSIEADVIFINDSLYVGHDSARLVKSMPFETTYLQPINNAILKNKGTIYADTSKYLYLLVDIKTKPLPTLSAIVSLLKKYPAIGRCRTLKLVITGNHPPSNTFSQYPSYIYFDGNLQDTGYVQQPDRIAIFSFNFASFSKWKGIGDLPRADRDNIQQAIQKAHALQKPVRFWGSPDNTVVWQRFIGLGIDFINTDKIDAFAKFVEIPQASPY